MNKENNHSHIFILLPWRLLQKWKIIWNEISHNLQHRIHQFAGPSHQIQNAQSICTYISRYPPLDKNIKNSDNNIATFRSFEKLQGIKADNALIFQLPLLNPFAPVPKNHTQTFKYRHSILVMTSLGSLDIQTKTPKLNRLAFH